MAIDLHDADALIGARGRPRAADLHRRAIRRARRTSACVEVIYRDEPGIGPPVPVEMRERYLRRRDGSRTEGVATYRRFRQFQVKVDEKIAPIKQR